MLNFAGKVYTYFYNLLLSCKISWHRCLTLSSCKKRVCLSCIVNIMGPDDLATQGTGRSATNMLTYLYRINLFPVRKGFWLIILKHRLPRDLESLDSTNTQSITDIWWQSNCDRFYILSRKCHTRIIVDLVATTSPGFGFAKFHFLILAFPPLKPCMLDLFNKFIFDMCHRV